MVACASKNNSFVNLLAVDHCHRTVFRVSPPPAFSRARTISRINAVSGRDISGERHATSAGDRSLKATRFGRLTVQTNHFLFRIVSTTSGTRNALAEWETVNEGSLHEGVEIYGRRVCNSRFPFFRFTGERPCGFSVTDQFQ